jgi:hypothetical protein
MQTGDFSILYFFVRELQFEEGGRRPFTGLGRRHGI